MPRQIKTRSVLILPIIKLYGIDCVPLVMSINRDELCYRIVGGGVENGEEFKKAATRECLEETGLLPINISDRIFLVKNEIRPTKDPEVSVSHKQYLLTSEAEDISTIFTEPVRDGKDLLATKIFSLEAVMNHLFNDTKLDGYNMLSQHIKILKKIVENEP